LKGLAGKRGPLRPPLDFRWALALWFFLVTPLCSAVVSALAAVLRGEALTDTFLLNWLIYTPFLWGVVFGPVMGSRLARAIGYHWSDMAGRLVELAIFATTICACVFAASFLHPKGWVLPLFGTGIGVLMGAVEFVRALLRRS
jgi:hypothetical protein